MVINNVNFKGNYGYEYNPYQPVSIPQEQPIAEDKQKSNAAKYMIGATALAGIIALGVAGYKGHLGKEIQNFMKSIEKEAGKITKKEPPTPPKTLEYKVISGDTAKFCEPSAELKGFLKLSDEELAKLGTFEHENFGELKILKNFENGKPQFAGDSWNIYEFDLNTGNITRRINKDVQWSWNAARNDWDSIPYISKIMEYDRTVPNKALSIVELDSEHNVLSYVKNTKWNEDLRPLVQEHYKPDMQTLESIFHNEYQGNTLAKSLEYSPDGKTLCSKRIYNQWEDVVEKHEYFAGTERIHHSTYYDSDSPSFISREIYFRKNGMKDKQLFYDSETHNLEKEYRYYPKPRFKWPWQKNRNIVQYEIRYNPENPNSRAITQIEYNKKHKAIREIITDENGEVTSDWVLKKGIFKKLKKHFEEIAEAAFE